MLSLNGFDTLEELVIGSHCFGGVDRVTFHQLNRMKTIVIGQSSFFNVSVTVIEYLPVLNQIELKEDSFHGRNDNSSLVLSHLPLLKTITSEGNSFAEVRNVTVISTCWIEFL